MKPETGRRFSEKWFGAAILTLGLILLGQALALVTDPLFPAEEKSGLWAAFRTYMADGWLWLMFIPVMLAHPDDRETVRQLVSRGHGKRAAAGAVLGFALIAVCYGAAWAAGNLTPVFVGASAGELALMLFAVLIQSGAEELAFRGFLLGRCLRDLKKPWMAILLNAVLFGALHLANENVTPAGVLGTAAMGALLAVLMWKNESLWQVILLHTAWNWLQNIIFGLPNSGWVFSCSLLGAANVTKTATFFYDPYFGLEGSWLCPLLAAAAALFLIYRYKAKL